MRWKAVLLIGSLTPLTGCNLAYYAGHNLVNEPVERLDEHKLTSRLKAESRTVWRDICRQFSGRTFTPEFADGFTDGYADHLENGGTPSPPAVPPLRYRRANYLTPQGHPLIRDYMIGFQYGAEVASATGKRQFLTVPILLPENQAQEPPLNVSRYPTPPETSTDVPGSVKPATPIPTPKAVDPGNSGTIPSPKPPDSGTNGKPDPKPINPADPSAIPRDNPRPVPGIPNLQVPKVELPTADPQVKPVSAIVVPSVLPRRSMPDIYTPEQFSPAVVPPLHFVPAALPPVPDPPAK